jgi:hypothetical protein
MTSLWGRVSAQSGMRMALLTVFVCAAAGMGGCAQTRWLGPPAGCPQEWRGRHAFATDRVLIYAHTEAGAREAARLVDAAATDFEQAAGVHATRGLLIVSDLTDSPPIDEPAVLFALCERAEAEQNGRRPPSDDELVKGWEDMQDEMVELGMQAADGLRMKPVPLRQHELTAVLGMPPEVGEGVQWGLLVPTEDAVRELIGRMIEAALKEEDVGLGKRILMAPVLPWVTSKAVDGVSAACRIQVFRLITESQAGWTPEERRRVFATYKARMEAQMTDGMMPPTQGVPR